MLAAPSPRPRRLLVVIDQFEELLTHTPAGERSRFVELLRPALGGPVHVVATLRPDFLDQLLLAPELAALPTRTHTLPPLHRDALAAVIEEPARLAGIGIDEGLVAQLVADTDSGEALPLLAYTLAQLADGVGRGGRLLASRYQQLGGVQGTLTRSADAALDEAARSGAGRDQVIRSLLRLVTVDEQGRPTRWRVPRNELPPASAAELEPFVARRLLTTDSADDGPTVEVAHESFLTAWPPLSQAVTANSTALRARRAVERAAEEWAGDGRAPARLWERGQLASALADTGARLAGSPRACRHPAGRAAARTRSRAAYEAGPAAAGSGHRPCRAERSGAGVSAGQHLAGPTQTRPEHNNPGHPSRPRVDRRDGRGHPAAGNRAAATDREQQQRIATARLLLARAEAAVSTDPRTALQLGEAAVHIHPDPETRSGLAHLLRATRYKGSLTGHTNCGVLGGVRPGRAHPGHRQRATARVILWDLTDPAQPRRHRRPPHRPHRRRCARWRSPRTGRPWPPAAPTAR